MGCTFCQTAQMGLIRSLLPHEIVGQWFAARHVILPDAAHGLDPLAPITNVVFMGMGEPLDNLESVLAAIEVLTDHNGVGLPMSKVTISTVGRIDGIRRLAHRVRRPGWHRLGFAVSLNAPTDEIRSSIMPVNRAMPLAPLREALLDWPIYGGFKFLFEYVLIPGVNDAPEHAREVADFILGRARFAGPRLGALLNLIPYNPRDGSPWPAPEDADVDLFLTWLTEEGVYAKRRRTKGRETMAACGQLGNPALRRRPRSSHPPAIPLTLASQAVE
jgi:23S rRNA (adenine2503-C2)-methyltransferase